MKSTFFLISFILCIISVQAQNPIIEDTITKQSPKHKGKVGLVLSGGGAKGIAHVGVIKALEDNDIPIDYIAGTSMGAIVGSLYCCGFSPEEMLELFTSKGFASWSSGKIDKRLTYYFDEPSPTPQWLQLDINPKDTSIFQSGIIPTNLINPLPMNFEFMKLFSPYSEQCKGNFNNLFVPFRCVTSDVYHKHKIVCRNGNLGNAVRASMSFPLVFKPIEMDGVLVYDGGIYDNFPVDVMHEDFNPEFMIGVSVSGPDGKPIPDDVYSQLEDLIIQNNDYNLPEKYGVKIQVPVLNFGVLDFGKAREIYEIGYKTGMQMVDSIKSRCPWRISAQEVALKRKNFKESTPVVSFDSISVSGNTTKGQAQYLAFLFNQGRENHTISMEDAENGYYRAISGRKVSDLIPNAEPYDNPHILALNATVKNQWSVGLGGWITSSTNSMLYLSAGYHTLSFNALDFNLSGWIGQSYYAGMLNAKFGLRTHIPSYIELQGVLSRQKFYESELLFYQTKTPTFINDHENYVRINFGWEMGRKGKGYFSSGYGYLTDDYFPTRTEDFAIAKKDRSTHKVFSFKLGYEKNTLDFEMYPTTGEDFDANVFYALDNSTFREGGKENPTHHLKNHSFGRLEILWRNFYTLTDKFNIGWLCNGVVTVGRPYQNYTSTLIQAPAFAPTPSTRNYFNIGYRADNYLAAGIIPIYKPLGNLQLRGDFYIYSPIRNLTDRNGQAVYNGWFKRAEFIGEIAAVYNFNFATLSIYGNYLTSPAHNWNFGISFGLYFQAPRFLR
ncbi:MAG: patatin-like phospholipase family protein [Prevotella sp.]|nr:patatin-like phospholipase family protein [Bacteroides sp.]MCM1366678.1 patatin-like phospholipase family protein [Prevotella sp.]